MLPWLADRLREECVAGRSPSLGGDWEETEAAAALATA